MTSGARKLFEAIQECDEEYGTPVVLEAFQAFLAAHIDEEQLPPLNYGDERYKQLMRDGGKLTREDIAEGWHFCPEFDYLLVGPGMEEFIECGCDTGDTEDTER